MSGKVLNLTKTACLVVICSSKITAEVLRQYRIMILVKFLISVIFSHSLINLKLFFMTFHQNSVYVSELDDLDS